MALLDLPDEDDHAADHFERSRYEGASAIRRVRLHNPPVLEAHDEFQEQLLANGAVDEELYEFIMVTVASANRCEYCATGHRAYLEETAGLSPEDAAAVAAGEYGSLTPRQRAVVEFAEQAATDPHRVTAGHVDALYDVGFDDGDIIQLLSVVGLCALMNTIASALHLDPDADPTR